MVVRLCVSISEKDAEFLDSMQLKPSGLLQQRIAQVREDSSNYRNMLQERENAILKLNAEIQRLNGLLESKENNK